ncbi:PAS domain S-box protein [Thiomicrorhabdus aquaedulcis]|uniref:PAS domain S-box protein n=1 Tax=Thiomicrorhabdus aquaedulcis TaxID=2211106 RepID=UPI000FDB6BA8|nr:PAS domain S-box protein [Thiomicrorhabdus aquaedulcis]
MDSIYYFLCVQAQQTQQRFIEKNIQTQHIAWQAVQKIHLKGIEAYFETVVNNPKVINNLRLALNPNQADIARAQLYNALLPLQDKLAAQNMNVFHFHTPTNQSFLRFHQPDKFGDDLSNVRISVTRANATLQAVHGFEAGRIESGFRHVFPIILHGEHLGSVELSQSFEPLRIEMGLLDPHSDFSLIQNKHDLELKSFSEFSALYQPSLFSSDWLEQTHQTPRPAKALGSVWQSDASLSKKLNQHVSFGHLLTLDGLTHLATFSAVKNLDNQVNAYLVSIKPAPEMDQNVQYFWFYALISTVTLLILGAAIHQNRRSNRAKMQTTHYLESLYNTMTEGLYATDLQGHITEVNEAALKILGYSKANLIGQNAHSLFHNPKESKHQTCPIETTITFEGELTFIHANGKSFAVHISSQPLHMHQKLAGTVVVFHDISHTKKAQDALRVAATAFESQDGIMITNAAGIILRVNQSFCRLTGYAANEVIGLTPAILNSGKQTQEFYRTLWEVLTTQHFWQGKIWNRRKDGTLYLEWLTITAVLDPELKITQYVANFSDITESHKNQAKIEKLAFYDPLTQLPNRRLLWDRLDLAIQKCVRTQEYSVLLL